MDAPLAAEHQPTNETTNLLSAEDIVNSIDIGGLKLSKDAKHAVYTAAPRCKPDKDSPTVSALWIAETDTENSARAITSGKFNDHSPVFHPFTSDIFFLSDRHEAGGPAQIYRLSVRSFGGEAVALTNVDNKQGVSSFAISPDGKLLAFTSADEPPEDEDKEEKCDIEIWGDKKDVHRLRLLELDNSRGDNQPTTLVSVDAHVAYFTWSPDSLHLFYRLWDLPDVDSMDLPSTEHIISVAPGAVALTGVFGHAINPCLDTVWTESGEIFSIQNVELEKLSSSRFLTVASESGSSEVITLAYGVTDDALGMHDVGTQSLVAVEVALGLDTRIDVYDSNHDCTPVFQTNQDSISLDQWDIRLQDNEFVGVAIKSSAVRGEPPEVWFGQTKRGTIGGFERKLSSHHDLLLTKSYATSKAFRWTGADGQDLEGIISYPAGEEPISLPTIISPHGGPYWRDQYDLSFRSLSAGWRHVLAPRGYLVIAPNFRGSLGRGNVFASAAHGGMGIRDWDDCQSMLDAVISCKMADPERVGMAGWSQGGFLTAWGCTRPGNRFKVGIMGAGVSDWHSLIIGSDMTSMEADLAGGAPWASPSSTPYLQGSAIREAANVTASMLIIHGKDDKRIPVSQAIGMANGIARTGGVRPQLLIYPREGHQFQERAHVEDVFRRVIEHLERHLK